MAKTLYTEAGLSTLANIIKQARGSMSYREFQEITGVSHATIRRLENVEVKAPEDATLAAIASQTPYAYEELKAIATQRQQIEVRKYLVAEDLLPYVNELPDVEAARLAQIIIARLAKMTFVL